VIAVVRLLADACTEQEGWKADLAVASIFITLIVVAGIVAVVIARRK
jgi:hypothetical protein